MEENRRRGGEGEVYLIEEMALSKSEGDFTLSPTRAYNWPAGEASLRRVWKVFKALGCLSTLMKERDRVRRREGKEMKRYTSMRARSSWDF